jgi:DNA ligase-1
LLPFARIALKDHEDFRAELETLVREHTHAKQGPVRLLRPALVAEIAFDGLALSKRHKSGLAVRNPRLLRLRPDLAPTAADALADVRGWL